MYSYYQRNEQGFQSISELGERSAYRKALADEYRKHYRDAFAAKTIRNLENFKVQFRRWCDEAGHDPQIPISPLVVAEYISYLGGKISAHTIRFRLWAISEIHKAEFYPSPCGHRLVRLAFRAVCRKYGSTTGQASPLCKSEVLSVIRSLGNTPIDIRDKALLYVASDSWCRASELVALKPRHISRQEDGSSIIYLERTKCSPYGRGEYAYLSPAGTRAVAQWVFVRGLEGEDPLFTRAGPKARKHHFAPETVSRIFKRRTGRPEVSAHSTRVGGVHDALRLGCSLVSIMVAGRWASPEMPAVYGRKIMAGNSAAAVVAEAYGET